MKSLIDDATLSLELIVPSPAGRDHNDKSPSAVSAIKPSAKHRTGDMPGVLT
ncbi:hypothetical protein CES86_3249 [Brucella lupini]|uniref:Uncharacterized protein n=1 Tax=Brucella lupini TaxID=255457 RepID=A0A256GIB2_9HYPH|nr:hypothetical protein CES86_3249 [Brucella lupini]